MKRLARPKKQKFPPGWDEAKVWRLVRYYENLDEDQLLAEHERVLKAKLYTLMSVPARLVPVVRELIASAERAQ